MAAEIEGYGTAPGAVENSRRVPPCMTGLATPMHEQYRPIAIVPPKRRRRDECPRIVRTARSWDPRCRAPVTAATFRRRAAPLNYPTTSRAYRALDEKRPGGAAPPRRAKAGWLAIHPVAQSLRRQDSGSPPTSS